MNMHLLGLIFAILGAIAAAICIFWNIAFFKLLRDIRDRLAGKS